MPGSYATPMDYSTALHAEIGDPARLRAVYGSAFMSKKNDVQLSTICQSAAQILRGRGSDLIMLTETHRKVVASWRDGNFCPAGPPMELETTICQHNLMALEDGSLPINDLREDERTCNLALINDENVVAYLGVPIVVNGHVVGALCVIDDKPRKWGHIDVMLLTGFAEEAMAVASIG